MGEAQGAVVTVHGNDHGKDETQEQELATARVSSERHPATTKLWAWVATQPAHRQADLTAKAREMDRLLFELDGHAA